MHSDTRLPATGAFTSLSVVLPVMNETTSLEATVDRLVAELGTDLGELIVVLSPRTTDESRETVARLAQRCAVPLRVHTQSLPYLGGALREAFDLAACSHVVMMASDLETDPATVGAMVDESRDHPDAIVTASRWSGTRRGRFEGYDPLKLVLNSVFQLLVRLLYRCRLSDATYGFRLFPTLVVQNLRWRELRHAFLLETILKPLRLGVPVIEVPTSWRARVEGRSSNTFAHNFTYAKVAVDVRLAHPASFLRAAAAPPLTCGSPGAGA
jgi:hypothetical protein